MSEENKYYTPELSEFHVGFNWQMKDPTNPGLWIDQVTSKLDYLEALDSLIKSGEIRVKLLDHSDILAAGWKSHPKHEKDDIRNYYYDSEMYANNYTKADDYLYFDNEGRLIIELNRGDYYGKVFVGTIKNASELNRIMKQVRII